MGVKLCPNIKERIQIDVFESRMVKRLFGFARAEMTGRWSAQKDET
jgi:hypothetical protein